MYAVAYRNTEHGSRVRLRERLAEETRRREVAERAAWDAKIREDAARKAFESHKAEVLRFVHRRPGTVYRHSFYSIEERALRVFKISRRELRSDRRSAHLVLARQFVIYWACRLTQLSLPQIGKLLGGRDHTTILHGKRRYPDKRAKLGRYLRAVR